MTLIKSSLWSKGFYLRGGKNQKLRLIKLIIEDLTEKLDVEELQTKKIELERVILSYKLLNKNSEIESIDKVLNSIKTISSYVEEVIGKQKIVGLKIQGNKYIKENFINPNNGTINKKDFKKRTTIMI